MKSLNFKAVLTLLFCMLFLAGCVTVPRQPLMAPAQGIYHIVGSSQTLYRIAKTYNVDINEIMQLNRITDPTQISVGQQLFISGAKVPLPVEAYKPISQEAVEIDLI